MISIVVPVYNTEKYLRQCIDSIIRQTCQDWELILVDDGSSDSSGSICDGYAEADARIKVIHQKNTGVSAARNAGIRRAAGEYLCFVDSDDWLDESFLEGFEVGKTNADMYVSGWIYDVNGKNYSYVKYNPAYCASSSEICMEFVRQNLDENGYPWGKLFRTSIVREHDLHFNEKLSINEDHIFVLQYYYLVNSLYIVSSCNYHYMVFDDSGRKLSSHFNSFDDIKLASSLFDEVIIGLNERWKFPTSYLERLKNEYVYGTRLLGMASLVNEKKIEFLNDEMDYWRNNSYMPQTCYSRFILFLIRRKLPVIAVFAVLYLMTGLKKHLPRNRTKLILNDISRRSTLV